MGCVLFLYFPFLFPQVYCNFKELCKFLRVGVYLRYVRKHVYNVCVCVVYVCVLLVCVRMC